MCGTFLGTITTLDLRRKAGIIILVFLVVVPKRLVKNLFSQALMNYAISFKLS